MFEDDIDIPTPISDQWLKGYDDNEMTLDAFRVMQTLEKKLTAAQDKIEMLNIRYGAAEMHHDNNMEEVTEQRDEARSQAEHYRNQFYRGCDPYLFSWENNQPTP